VPHFSYCCVLFWVVRLRLGAHTVETVKKPTPSIIYKSIIATLVFALIAVTGFYVQNNTGNTHTSFVAITIDPETGNIQAQTIEVNPTQNIEEIIEQYRARPDVIAAGINYPRGIQLYSRSEPVSLPQPVVSNSTPHLAQDFPNFEDFDFDFNFEDFEFPTFENMPSLEDFPEMGSPNPVGSDHDWTQYHTNDEHIEAQWGYIRLGGKRLHSELGSAGNITVAVIDTGVDASHPDLGGRVISGWDSINSNGDGRTDPNGHGTHVAGILGATVNNIGIAGMASNVRIMPIRVLGADGYGDDAHLAMGIIYAAENGANIINMSVGGAEPSTLLSDAIAFAQSRNVLLIASAGNDNILGNQPSYPAAYSGVLAVGATDSFDKRSFFSNTGGYLELAAPGSTIFSTWPGGNYVYSSGTSMSAPFVSGAAALVAAQTGLRGSALRSRLTSNALDLGTPGRDSSFGFGLVDALSATGRTGMHPEPMGVTFGKLPGFEFETPNMPSFEDIEFPSAPVPEVPVPSRPDLPDGWGLPEPIEFPTWQDFPEWDPDIQPPSNAPAPTPPDVPSTTPPQNPSNPPSNLPQLPSDPPSDPSSRPVLERRTLTLAVSHSIDTSHTTIEGVLSGDRLVSRYQPVVLTLPNGTSKTSRTDGNGKVTFRVPNLPGQYVLYSNGTSIVKPFKATVTVP